MSTSIVLFADDLSGALDSAVPFRAAGHDVAVAIDPAAMAEAMARRPDMLVVNLDCRAVPVGVAAERVRSLAPVMAALAPRLVMLKIDSRLKGPVAALIEAAMAISGRRQASVCPAAPDVGRLVVAGHVVGKGIDSPIAVVSCTGAGPAIVCHDASDAAAIEAVAAVILDEADTTLAVGARGLAQAFAALIGRGRLADDPDVECAPIILAIGSRDPITAEQVRRLRGAVTIVDGRDVSGVADRADATLLTPPIVASKDRDPAEVAAALAEEVAAAIDRHAGATIIVSGGDTAMAVARRMDWPVLLPQRELLPGMPLSTVPALPTVRLVTKSGGFGDPDALVACLASLSGSRRSGQLEARASA